MIDKPFISFSLPDVEHFAFKNIGIAIPFLKFEVEISDFVVVGALIFLIAQLKQKWLWSENVLGN